MRVIMDTGGSTCVSSAVAFCRRSAQTQRRRRPLGAEAAVRGRGADPRRLRVRSFVPARKIYCTREAACAALIDGRFVALASFTN